MSKEKLSLGSASPSISTLGIGDSSNIAVPNLPKPLTIDEKKFLLAVERGDLANVRRMLQRAHRRHHFNIDCVDPLGRGALTLAIDGENLEMVEILIIMGVMTKDALLQAINAEFVEAVELLLEHEELIHKEGDLYSWQKVDITATFTPDITPIILAAHRNNYEILKILLDRGATIPVPHDIKCGCDDCIRQSSEDSLRHSLTRVNQYKALSSPSLIALSSNDPLLTAFQLSWELRNLAFQEQECKSDYLELRRQCQQFAVDLLDQSRSSQELAIILNHDPESPPYMDGDHMKLARLELAINYKQKKFVAHPNIQQLLAALWYEGVPGFRRLSATRKALTCVKVAVLFPIYCLLYMVAPNCGTGELMRKPFMKFLIHASSYLFFLFILILVSQRAEVQVIQLFGTESMRAALVEQLARQRGNGPTILECVVVVYVLGFIWEETQEIYAEGIRSYLRNMWNFIDFSRNFLYCLVGFLRVLAFIQQTSEISKDASKAYIPREHFDDFDPQLIAEGLFAAANIFSALKLVHLFSINPHLGPLQISLGRMVIDIVKFFCIYSLVLLAFACGLNQLLWYFADLEKQKCFVLPNEQADWDNQGDACMKWRRFENLFESSQSLFWASFGMVGLENFELAGIKSYTRFWALLMFGSYSVINVIVLLNLLIAMMSNSYAMIDEHSDTEWKFARTKLWMSYFEDSATLPPPFNIFPTVKIFLKMCGKTKKREIHRESTIRRKVEKERENRYTNVMRSLVWRYVCAMHRKVDDSAVTEDDINEVKMEISAMRYEFLEIFEKSGMDVSGAEKKEKAVLGKKMKIWERRLMKDFHVAPMQDDAMAEEDEDEAPVNETGLSKFRRMAQKVVNNSASSKWGQVIRDVAIDTQIGRCRNRQSFKNQQNLQRAMEQARRLVEQQSPRGSGTISPFEIPDETNNTLMELLKNISEDIGEVSPMQTLAVKMAKSRPISPNVAQLIQDLNQKSPVVSPNMITKNQQPTPSVMKANLPKAEQSSAKEIIPSTSLPPPYSPLVRSPPPILPSSPPPMIQITSSDNEKAKTPEPEPIKADFGSPSLDSASLDESQDKKSPIKKRKAPVPEVSAVARPVAPKPQSGKGMIPPPPAKKEDSPGPESEKVPIPSPAHSRPPSSDCIVSIVPKCDSPLPTIVTIPSNEATTISIESFSVGSTEKLVPDKDDSTSSNINVTASPSCLRPIRRIEDVQTIKRQPKTGWL